MNIPEAAVEAAAIALYEQAVNASMNPDAWPEWGADGNRGTRNAFAEDADAALAAAAPYIAAQALRDAADEWESLVQREVPPVRGSVWLRRRADRIEADRG